MYAEMHINFHVKYLLLLSNFNYHWNLSVNFSKPPQYQMSWNYVQLICVFLEVLIVNCCKKSYCLRNNRRQAHIPGICALGWCIWFGSRFTNYLWWSLKIDSNRTTWLKFTNSLNFKLFAHPYSVGYSVFQNNEAYCLPLVVTTLQYLIQTLFLFTFQFRLLQWWH